MAVGDQCSKGNCKISKSVADRLRKGRLVDRAIILGKKEKLIVQRVVFLLPLQTAVISALPSLTNDVAEDAVRDDRFP